MNYSLTCHFDEQSEAKSRRIYARISISPVGRNDIV